MKKLLLIISITVFATMLLISCGKKDSSKEITVMVPPWAELPSNLLDEFTKESGIKVLVNTVSWDDIRNKVSVAAVGQTAAADVFEVDWSWVGEMGAANYLATIDLTEEDLKDIPTIDTFKYEGNVVAIPYVHDFRIAFYNKEQFEKAGIMSAPKNWDEVTANIKKIKEAKVVEYPITIPISAKEATTTSLIWLTISRSGAFFNSDMTINKANVLSSLQYIKMLIDEKLLDPASVNIDGREAYNKMLSEEASFMVGPLSYAAKVASKENENVNGKVIPILVPGNGKQKTISFALPEGLGVSKYSKNTEGATAFVKWYTSKNMQNILFSTNDFFPTRTSVMNTLNEEKKIAYGDIIVEQTASIINPFTLGVPLWYSEMSYAVYNAVNQVAKGAITPEVAADTIDTKVKELLAK